jgi:hypothetical protein
MALKWSFVPLAVAAALVATSSAAASPPPARPPALQLSGPARLVLGVDRSAEVIVAGAREPGLVALHANVGSISAARARADGRLAATYTPPAARFPQVAVIAAVVVGGSEGGSDFAWTSIPLHGTARVTTKTERKAEVVLRVAGKDHGPVTASRRGRAAISVEVPPGVGEATTIAVDRAGNRTEKPLPLSVPPFSRLLAVCPSSGDRLLLFATDAGGRPLDGGAFDLGIPIGRMSAVRRLAAGVYEARFSIGDAATTAPFAEVSAAPRGPRAVAARCRMPIPGELPSAVAVTLDRRQFTPGEPPIEALLELRYRGRRAPRPAEVAVQVEAGVFTAPQRIGPASFRVRWTPPSRFDGRARVALRVRAVPVGGADSDARAPAATGEAAVELRPGAPARVDVELTGGDALAADGHSRAPIRVLVRDRFGNPVPGARLLARSAGLVGPFRAAAGGKLAADYVAPRSRTRWADRLQLVETTTGLAGTADIRLRPLPRRVAAGFRLGYVTNLRKMSSPAAVADVSVRLPFGAERFELAGEVGVWRRRLSESADGEMVTTSIKAVPVRGRLTYELPLARLALFGGAGGGVILTSTEVSSASAGVASGLTTLPAVGALVGARLRAGPGRLGVEAGWWHASLDRPELRGSMAGLEISAGYALGF